MNRLLIVEDSKMSNNLIKRRLKSNFQQIDQAYSLKEAEGFLEKESYDLIILDMHLPDGEGIELVDAIHNVIDAKIIVLTSSADISLREELFRYGILDYIIKDANFFYSIEEIIRVIEKLNEKKHKKILIIDDSKFICSRINKVLTPRGYETKNTFNGEEGIKKALNEKFDLIILDMELPDIHGIEVLKKLRSDESLYHVPIVVLSGTSSPEVVRDILKNGANDYIQKPFVIEEFILKIDLWVDYFEKEKELVKKTKELEELNSTLEKRVEEEIEKRREKEKFMLLQNRYAQMGEVIAMIAHQWKQPLNVLSLASIYLRMKCDDSVKDTLSKIDKSVKYMSKTIDEFRNFFKPQKEKTLTNWKKIIDKALKLFRANIDNLEIEVHIKKIENFKSYDNELMQVVLNILKNAKDAIDEKKTEGKIDITVEGKKIVIEDNAGGIPEYIIDKIFDPYFSTKSKNGTGLGLYMSKIIVEEHANGKLSVENGERGARFVIEI